MEELSRAEDRRARQGQEKGWDRVRESRAVQGQKKG